MEKAELEVTIKCEVEDDDPPNEDYKSSFPVSSTAQHVLRETATSTTDDNLKEHKDEPKKTSVTIATQTTAEEVVLQ